MLKERTLVIRPASWMGAVQQWLCGVVWKLALNVLQYSSTRSKMAAVSFSTTFSVRRQRSQRTIRASEEDKPGSSLIKQNQFKEVTLVVS